MQHGWWVVFCTHFTCHPTIICGLGITNNVWRWTNISLGVCLNVKLQWFWQFVFCRCVRFIEDNDKSMVAHEFGDIMFSCQPFHFQTSCKLFHTCCWSIFLLHFEQKCCWLMSTISDKVLWNVEVRLVELVIFLNNEVLSPFIFPIVVFIMPSSRTFKNLSTKLDYTRSIQVLMSKID